MLKVLPQNDSVRTQLLQSEGSEATPSFNITQKRIDPSIIEKIESLSRDQQAIDTLERESVTSGQKPVLNSVQNRETFTMLPMTGKFESRIEMLEQNVEKTSISLPERRLGNSNPEWVIGIFILVFALFASIRVFFNRYLKHLFQSSINYGASFRLFRERSLSLTNASVRLDIIFYLVFSLLLYQSLDFVNIQLLSTGILSYSIILIGTLLFFNIKKLAYYIQGSITESLPETMEFIFNMNLYNRILGLFLVPVCLIVAFSPVANPEFMLLTGGILIAILYIFMIFRGMKILLKKHFSIFYLILYLCTLEILPLIFIYKLVLK